MEEGGGVSPEDDSLFNQSVKIFRFQRERKNGLKYCPNKAVSHKGVNSVRMVEITRAKMG